MSQFSFCSDEGATARSGEDLAKSQRPLPECASGLVEEGECQAAWPEGYWSIYGILSDESFQAPQELDLALDGRLPVL